MLLRKFMNQNTHDLPKYLNLAAASFADHTLRFNSRNVSYEAEVAGSGLVRRCVMRNFYLFNFSRLQTKPSIAAVLSGTLRVYKLICRRTAVINIFRSVIKNVILIRFPQLWTLYQFRSLS